MVNKLQIFRKQFIFIDLRYSHPYLEKLLTAESSG